MLKIRNIIDTEKCVSCGACVSICPKSCISFNTVKNGFSYPSINESNCINCKLCDKSCPQLKEYKARQPLNCYAISSKNNEILKNSSSGGFFYYLAKYVISLNGVVYGAKLDKSKVNHVRIRTIERIPELMGSKYSQSNMECIFSDVKKDLETKSLVLFTGTPCQVQGLISFLDKSSIDNLITMDLICRGIPNPSVFSSYFNYLEYKFNSDITDFSFRSKKNGWMKGSIKIECERDTIYEYSNENCYMKLFYDNKIIRKSCFDCNAKGFSNFSDFTVGDFWTVKSRMPKAYNKYGVSLVTINSYKAKEILDSLKTSMIIFELDINQVLEDSFYLTKSVEGNECNEEIMEKIDKDFMSFWGKLEYSEPKQSILSKLKRRLFSRIN